MARDYLLFFLFLFIMPLNATATKTSLKPWVWNVSTGVAGNYEASALVFTLQGLANRNTPQLFLNTGAMDFDYPQSDVMWMDYLSKKYNAVFRRIEGDLCELVATFFPHAFDGIVLYNSDTFSVYVAMTIAGQRDLLPVSVRIRNTTSCLRSLPIKVDLTKNPALNSKLNATKWAMDHFLATASDKVLFNSDHYPNANGGMAEGVIMSVDYAIAERAFVMDLCPLFKCDPLDCKPPSTRRGTPEEAALYAEIVSSKGKLVSVFGWGDPEHSTTNITAHAGGVVFCSFSSPNLSFWSRLGGVGRAMPQHDNSHQLMADNTYLLFETNEGDTPRILTSQFTGAWLSKDRGSVPVAWAVDPLLGRLFPALWNFYAETATANDTFVAGVDGAGYVYVDSLGPHASGYEQRAVECMQQFNLSVVDVGVASAWWPATRMASIATYNSRAHGHIHTFLNACGTHWGQRINTWLDNGTPVINSVCVGPRNTTDGHFLYYYRGSLNQTDPAGDLAGRIETAAVEHKEKGHALFMVVFGGLGLYGHEDNFFLFLRRVMGHLGTDFVAVGAHELARLAHEGG